MMADQENPFLAESNPFMAASTKAVAKLPPCGDPTCKRRHRPNLTGQEAHYSSDPKERQLQLTQEGRIGPQYGALSKGVKRKNKTAARLISEAAAEKAEDIRQVFLDGIDPNQPMGIRMQAAKQWLDVESKEEDRMAAEAQADFDNMTKGELVSGIKEALAALQAGSELSQEVIEATVIDE